MHLLKLTQIQSFMLKTKNKIQKIKNKSILTKDFKTNKKQICNPILNSLNKK